MILEAMYNGEFYPCETVVPTSPEYHKAIQTCAALMEQLSQRLSKEDYALVGDLFYRQTGSLIAFEAGEAITYGLFNAQERGTLFIGPGVKVYSGMVVGQSPKAEDIEINVCKTKKLTNTRSSSADEALKLTPPKIMSLEQALDFIDTDELLEVTPESLRIRKKILDPTLRKRASFKNK